MKKTKDIHIQTQFLSKLTSYTLIIVGVFSTLISLYYSSSILAIIGLGFFFCGLIFTYIRTDEYVKKNVLDTICIPQIAFINQILQEYSFLGEPIYLPPKYFKRLETQKVFLSKQKGLNLPTPEQIQMEENHVFIQNPPGMLIIPTGSELTKLFEKTLDINFNRVDLSYLQLHLYKLLTEDLELVSNFEMNIGNYEISVKIENPVFALTKTQNKEAFPFNFPLGDAIACAITKVTGKPIVISEQEINNNNKVVIITYRIINEEVTIN